MRDKGYCKTRALMDVLEGHLVRGDVEGVVQAVFEALHDHALLLERLRIFDRQLENGDDDEHAAFAVYPERSEGSVEQGAQLKSSQQRTHDQWSKPCDLLH